MADSPDIQEAFEAIRNFFNIQDLNEDQKLAIIKLVIEKEDVFVNLPTGYGKSLIFQCLPLVFDSMTKESGHIVLVLSPLLTLIDDQLQNLRALGLSCVSLSHLKTEEEMKDVEKGAYQVVYTTPEAILKNKRWREMLHNEVYKSKLCAIAVDEAHVIKQWGTTNTSKMAPFRECYGRLHELRSIAPPVNILAVTATATKNTRDAIIDVLQMKSPYEICESPEKPNIIFVVEAIPAETNLLQCFKWLADEFKIKGNEFDRTIIYCQTINQCGRIYSTLRDLLGDHFYGSAVKDERDVTLEMLHSCSPAANKDAILKSFSQVNGTVRILVATIAFGMGLDCKGVHRTIHFGPSKNLESYIQETGRAGRDGQQSVSYLLYNGLLLAHVEKDIKSYISNTECRRKTLLKNFSVRNNRNESVMPHLCCDNCTRFCKCGTEKCVKPSIFGRKSPNSVSKTREVTNSQKVDLSERLTLYHKSIVMKFSSEHAHSEMKYFTKLHMLVGFSDLQINQVVENCHHLFTINDICNHIEIWHMEHAFKIHQMLSEVFGDVSAVQEQDWEDDETEVEDAIEHAWLEWAQLADDEDFMELFLENVSIESSMHNEGSTCDAEGDIPNAVLDILENLSFN